MGYLSLLKISHQIPSVLISSNKYLMLLIISGMASSLYIRYCNEISLILSSVNNFVYYILISLSILYIIYIQLNIVFRLGHILKFIPFFTKLLKKGIITDIKIICLYLLSNSITIVFSF